MFIDSISVGLSEFRRVIPSAAAQCSECLFFSHSLTLSLTSHGEIEVVGSRLRNVFDLTLVKAPVCPLP
jgi:hypothetical protein